MLFRVGCSWRMQGHQTGQNRLWLQTDHQVGRVLRMGSPAFYLKTNVFDSAGKSSVSVVKTVVTDREREFFALYFLPAFAV